MTDIIDLGYDACIAGRSDGRCVVYWFDCRSERHRAGFGKKGVSKHVHFLLAARRGGEGVRSD